MKGKTYWELLRDPAWQRRRLEILQRAEFTCEYCSATEKTLHVHHRIYRKGSKPWEYADHELIVLCEDCHDSETAVRREIAEALALLDDGELSQVLGYAVGIAAASPTMQRGDPRDGIHKMRDSQYIYGFVDAVYFRSENGPEKARVILDLHARGGMPEGDVLALQGFPGRPYGEN